MRINSVNNFNITSFGNENVEAPVSEQVNENPIKKDGAPALKPQPEQDIMQREQAPQGFHIPTVGEISKMQTTQKVMGGALAGVGLFGMASAFIPKTWARCLFAIPVGGIITYFGANMFNMANSLNKLKSMVSNNNETIAK